MNRAPIFCKQLTTAWLATLLLVACAFSLHAQQIPSRGENIPYLVTFGNEAPMKWGDDDYCQVFFFVIPKSHKGPVYIRIFDPDVGGSIDQSNGEFDTETRFSVFGGLEAYSHPDAQGIDPVGQYKSGNLLASERFTRNSETDGKWFPMGPFNPSEGEYREELGGYIFKVICEGTKGNDGNLYKYYLSKAINQNIPIEGGNGFTYEYSFRLPQAKGAIAHVYPYVDQNVVAIKQNNFDFDDDGFIKIFSVARNGHPASASGESSWSQTRHEIMADEKGKSMNIQFIRKGDWENDMVFYITNQFDRPMPFFAIPIGGVPKYKYDIQVKVNRRPRQLQPR